MKKESGNNNDNETNSDNDNDNTDNANNQKGNNDDSNASRTRKGLRTGYTTGSSAAAAAKAALLAVITNNTEIRNVYIKTPKGVNLCIPISSCVITSTDATTNDINGIRCSVIKDGGDDPDVTHGAQIVVALQITDTPGEIVIDGGEGVGTVTKPGLGLQIGGSAINPVPRKMITWSLQEVGADILKSKGVKVIISVPKGKELGPKTDNPRIGITGGISILGTSGIVIPFSTASYAASIRQNLDVIVAMGEDTAVLTTGGRSEEFAKKILEGLPDHCFVQMGDFAGYSIKQCGSRKNVIKKVYVVGFIGKLAKLATGVKQTHVKGSKVNMVFLAGLASRAGADDQMAAQIKMANTARHVLEIIQSESTGIIATRFFDILCDKVHVHMRSHSGASGATTTEEDLPIQVILFGFDGNVLARSSSNGY